MTAAEIDNIVSLLASTVIFSVVGKADLKEIAEKFSREKTFMKGETVFSKDTDERCIGVILRGDAVVRKEHIVISRLRLGDVFGAVTLYNKCDAFVNNIIAKSDCRVLFISKEGVEALIQKSPVFSKNYIEYLSQRIYFLNGKIESYTMPTAQDKLYNSLLEMSGGDSLVLNVRMTDLAKSLNLSRASLYRAFDALCEDGKIIKDGKNIQLL